MLLMQLLLKLFDFIIIPKRLKLCLPIQSGGIKDTFCDLQHVLLKPC